MKKSHVTVDPILVVARIGKAEDLSISAYAGERKNWKKKR